MQHVSGIRYEESKHKSGKLNNVCTVHDVKSSLSNQLFMHYTIKCVFNLQCMNSGLARLKPGTVRITLTTDAFALPLLPWKSNKYYIFYVCVWSLSYPTCIAHAPCNIVICVLPDSNHIFPHYLINGTIFGGWGWGSQGKMCVLVFSTKFV